jgi:hypothetical protein
MLPDANDFPALFLKEFLNEAVAATVLFDFTCPIGSVARRAGTVFRATVPKTTIHEDCDS